MSRREDDLEREINAHLEFEREDRREDGLPPRESASGAHRALGNPVLIKERTRDTWRWNAIEAAGRDLRFAARRALHSPGFTLLVAVVIALTVGVNTAIFSLFDVAFLKPLPYPEPDRLAMIEVVNNSPRGSSVRPSVTGAEWEAIRDRATLLESAVYSGWIAGVNCSVGDRSFYLKQQRAGEGFARVLGVSPAMGRWFTPEEDLPGGPKAVVLSDGLRRKLFSDRPDIIGRRLFLRGEPYTIAGVMPAGFQSGSTADLWTPLQASRRGEGGGNNYGVIARAKAGVAWGAVQGELDSVSAEMARSRPAGEGLPPRFVWESLQSGRSADIRLPLLLLGGALDAMLLVSLGGLLSIPVAMLALKGLKLLGSDIFLSVLSASLDGRAILAAAGLTLLAGLAAGVLPAIQGVRTQPRDGHAGGRGVAGRRRFVPLGALVSLQIALVLPLLIASGLLGRSFMGLWSLDPGFDPENLLAARISLQDARYETRESVVRLFREGTAKLRGMPGVEGAAASLTLPYERPLNSGFRYGAAPAPGERPHVTNVVYVTPEYWDVMRIPLLRGRVHGAADQNGSPVVVVNQAFVAEYMKTASPLDQVIRMEVPYRIIGVVGNVQQRPGWGDFGPLAPMPAVYVLPEHLTGGFFKLIHQWFAPAWIVRSPVKGEAIERSVEAAVASLDPLLPIARFESMDQIKTQTLGMQRLLISLFGVLAALGLLLCVMGVYGLVSSTVAERTREIGIRMALGATIAQVIRGSITPGLRWSALGLVAGAPLVYASQKVVARLIYGIGPFDWQTYCGIAALVVCAVLTASFTPALRLARLDPAVTLREE